MHLHQIYHFVLIHCHLRNLCQADGPCRQPRAGGSEKGHLERTAPRIRRTSAGRGGIS